MNPNMNYNLGPELLTDNILDLLFGSSPENLMFALKASSLEYLEALLKRVTIFASCSNDLDIVCDAKLTNMEWTIDYINFVHKQVKFEIAKKILKTKLTK